MKLTAAELKRLMELMAKSADKLSDAEKTELNTLKAKAEASSDTPTGEADTKSVTQDELTNVVHGAVTKAMTGQVNEAQVKAIVETAVKGISAPGLDVKALQESITASVKASMPAGITGEDVKAIVETAVKGIHRPQAMVHDDTSVIETPISHRLGNLAIDAKQLLNVMTKGADFIDHGIPESMLKQAAGRGELMEKRMFNTIRQQGAYGFKAVTTTGAGTGLEFMNTSLSSTLLQRMYLESLLAASLVANEIQMPTNPYTFPLSTTRPTFKTGSETTAATASNLGSGKLTLDAKKLIGKVEYSYEADEDALVPILPLILAQLGEASADAIEDAVINGDADGTHQDSDTQADALHAARLWDGIRKLSYAQADLKISLASGGASAANIAIMRKALKRWGMLPKNLLIIAGTDVYNDLVVLPETLTAEKVGGANTARILTGMAPNLFGIDIVPSARMREDLNATGFYDGTTTTKKCISIIHKPSWYMGVRRGFTVEQDKDISNQTKWVVASFRRDFKPLESLATTKAAVSGFNF